MERTLKIITLDIKKKKSLKNLMLSILGMIPILFLAYIINNDIDLPMVFFELIPYIMIITFSYSLTQEFTNKTDKIIFTGIYNRTEILISKLIGFIITSIILFISYKVLACLFSFCIGNSILEVLNVKILLSKLYIFLLYAFTIGSFIMLVSAITSNGIVTGICTYILYFDLILALLGKALTSNTSQVVKTIIRNLPFYIANNGFYMQNYSLDQSMVMIISGCMFFTTACVIINTKNM